ncbi:MAG: alpha/beta hydrolase [Oscillospiraceae bacterium]|jgi:acetyl esterase/lipase|nr:alpha/beta hydrolase [Oscillospiraceae bacterium]
MICENIVLDPARPEVVLTTYRLYDSPEYDTGKRRPAVLICPGGAYLRTADREAEFVALAFAAQGYHAFVLRYSCGARGALPQPVLEAFRAIALIRAKADEWFVDPNKIAVLGFSAGGHLASMTLTAWKDADMLALLPGLTAVQIRPDAGILCYPCIIFPSLIKGMDDTMMGRTDYTPAEAAAYSTDRKVDGDTPPCYVWTTATDAAVRPGDSFAFVRALMAAGVSAEFHLFAEGEHGMSLAVPQTAGRPAMIDARAAAWFPMAVSWLALQMAKDR